jgi:hypothetical protein
VKHSLNESSITHDVGVLGDAGGRFEGRYDIVRARLSFDLLEGFERRWCLVVLGLYLAHW